jgi:hypothetical protein
MHLPQVYHNLQINTQIHLYLGGPEYGYEYLKNFVYVNLHVFK